MGATEHVLNRPPMVTYTTYVKLWIRDRLQIRIIEKAKCITKSTSLGPTACLKQI